MNLFFMLCFFIRQANQSQRSSTTQHPGAVEAAVQAVIRFDIDKIAGFGGPEYEDANALESSRWDYCKSNYDKKKGQKRVANIFVEIKPVYFFWIAY